MANFFIQLMKYILCYQILTMMPLYMCISYHFILELIVCKDQHHLNDNNHAGKIETNNISWIYYSTELIRHIYFSSINLDYAILEKEFCI